MERDCTNKLYDTNKRVRDRVDKILEKTNSLWANVNTKSSKDPGNRAIAAAMELRFMMEIKELDELFFYNNLQGKHLDRELGELLANIKEDTLDEFINNSNPE